MKRSEMIYTIAGLLSALYETNKHPETQLSKAKNILDVLEELGMLPPRTRIARQWTNRDNSPGTVTEYVQANEWEPEGYPYDGEDGY